MVAGAACAAAQGEKGALVPLDLTTERVARAHEPRRIALLVGTFIIANTVKGKGVSFMENVAKWHHGVPSEAELKQALADLDAAEAKLKGAK